MEWARIAAFRNVVVHNYLGIDLAVVWDIVRDDLPVLQQQLETIVRELGADGPRCGNRL